MEIPVLILASASPIRRQLLENAGLTFRTMTADIDERALEDNGQIQSGDAETTALTLAAAKAGDVSVREPDALIIGADQTLFHNGTALHKPANLMAAKTQLQHLRGETHTLHAAVTLVRDGELLWSHVGTAKLTMRHFTDNELQAVLDAEGEQLLGSVGAYRLEGPSIRLFESIEGDYFTILGLPLLPVLEGLRQHGFPT